MDMPEVSGPSQPLNGESPNGQFLKGLLTGALVGAAVGVLFAPRAGNEVRHQIADTGARWKKKATDTYDFASSAVNEIVAKGREVVDRGRDASKGARAGV